MLTPPHQTCGFLLQSRDMSQPLADIRLAYQDVDGAGFKIRGQEYMKNKLKVSDL